MKRYPDWQLRLEAFVREQGRKPFAWGSNDCALFAAGCIESLTGERVCQELRGQYTTEREALRILQQGGGLAGLATQALGEPIPVQLAAIGDVVLAALADRECLAICNGTSAIAAGLAGMVTISMHTARLAWRVG